MNLSLFYSAPSQTDTECLVVPVMDEGEKDKNAPRLATSDSAVPNVANPLFGGEVTGKMLETTLLFSPQGLKAKRLLLIGGGKAKSFGNSELRKLAGAAVRFLKQKNVRSFTFVLPEGTPEAVRAAVEGAYVGSFDSDYYRSDRKDQKITDLHLLAPGARNDALEHAMQEGRIIGESQNFTRDLVNEPSNRMTPTIMADRARKMAADVGIQCEVLGGDRIKQLKMGAFWSVAQGSDEPPALIVLRYDPPGAPTQPVLGLVGKGITFDTGGISIKPADGMEKMKYDMGGGAAVLGAMRAIALLKLKVKVICIVCAAENMPSGKAQKPGDVQIAMSGKSIEVINTDAEGRLVLADGLHYARQLGATHLIDAATLTGACVVALGGVNAGAFTNHEGEWKRLEAALARSGEKMWRLPVDDDYKELIRSGIADIKNTGGRYGGAITAAMFLKEFVEETPWIHLDIAGVAWMEENKPWIAQGPTGVAVRSITEWARDFSNNSN